MGESMTANTRKQSELCNYKVGHVPELCKSTFLGAGRQYLSYGLEDSNSGQRGVTWLAQCLTFVLSSHPSVSFCALRILQSTSIRDGILLTSIWWFVVDFAIFDNIYRYCELYTTKPPPETICLLHPIRFANMPLSQLLIDLLYEVTPRFVSKLWIYYGL
jgi:hypothetical protein